MEVLVKIKLLDPNIQMPLKFTNNGDACADIRSNESLVLQSG